ncbi:MULTISPECIES: hypothetical protein [unclassified Psychrobacter]|uniref:hypothetical protein n=1 Tax=unclassified Psychrobacter TaxID=196806 RepID=UPI0025B3A08E|nr:MULTISPECIES: hypothetical protein [unclassified Psychrobacter]MDN3452514.1 hypothetical protein [Psychrobacter sp. APC 3350]MDN3502346.1 hypothetical protein [Psychrobacter sp. 5A.1]
MDTKNATNSSELPETVQLAEQKFQSETQQRSLVPKGITIGLAVFALVLSLAGYGFRLMVGDDTGDVLRHAAVIVPAFMLGIPLFFWVGSRILNKVKGMHIEGWNAISLGYLTSCISMLWLMGTYS